MALIAFAANSVLCRLALGDNTIDAASFTWVRLLSGMLVLIIILAFTRSSLGSSFSRTESKSPSQDEQDNLQGTSAADALSLSKSKAKGSWRAAILLFIYAITFSFAYISLATGMGALILFASVQLTMVIASLLSGKKLHYTEWIGLIMAFCGFIYLVMPTLATPSLSGFILMTISGIAWAGYTLMGRGSASALGDTSYNFLRTLPFVILLILVTFQDAQLSNTGLALAIVSGGLASGIGYTIWYIALTGLSSIQAAVVQLVVPVIAAIGGIIFAGESISMRLILASAMILGGILFLIVGKYVLESRGSRHTKENESN
ncbi:DMT family transporter [Shewanella psychropiezotolerans]|uniref:DMT family transporter n=1 Tax=Shewanella psychropiezotolerans TaxID=2593655 RepID=A0ABX5X9X9_9GAMM|nr:DMT family transporter [Shewanella sp. YLB-07]QDO86743.1 DMT family transporter [Shewanella psychropiezotolerans]